MSDQPVRLVERTSGKGCRLFLIPHEPMLGRDIRYCDVLGAQDWNDVRAVVVYQSTNRFGLQIESVLKAL